MVCSRHYTNRKTKLLTLSQKAGFVDAAARDFRPAKNGLLPKRARAKKNMLFATRTKGTLAHLWIGQSWRAIRMQLLRHLKLRDMPLVLVMALFMFEPNIRLLGSVLKKQFVTQKNLGFWVTIFLKQTFVLILKSNMVQVLLFVAKKQRFFEVVRENAANQQKNHHTLRLVDIWANQQS